MKRIIVLALVCTVLLAGCIPEDIESVIEESDVEEVIEEVVESVQQSENHDAPQEMIDAINDWILGTEYGIDEVEFSDSIFTIIMSQDKQNALDEHEMSDIQDALINIGKTFGYDDCQVIFADGTAIADDGDTADGDGQDDDTNADSTSSLPAEGETINLIFIHHSVGENWLNDGLNEMLNDNNIHVADTYYGWSDMGDYTDTEDWPRWFNDDVMPSVYSELGTETASNSIDAGAGENTIIMFKSCFPNSDVGNSIDDEKAIYDSLLTYFAHHPDKMFVLITPPPMQNISHPDKARELTDYLVRRSGWLRDYTGHNVFVFDLYNVLTYPDNHHMLVDDSVKHVIVGEHNTLYYDSAGDDHPNSDGNIKAAEEFVPLLIYWYEMFANQ